ncbi:DUF6998 domain-containing protein [Desulfosporosinus fructosivorans]
MKKKKVNTAIEEAEAIETFFKAAQKLRELEVVRSTQYVGNIAEFICSKLYGIELSQSQREEGIDGIDQDGRRVEIKFHDGPIGTNIPMYKYKDGHSFQDIIIILGPNSNLRPKGKRIPHDAFLIYRINDYIHVDSKNIAKTQLKTAGIDKILDEHFFNELTP